MRLVMASRKSDLARLQAYRVTEALKLAAPELEIQFHFRESLGDKEQTNPLWQMPEKGVFTEDFVQGLMSGEFDLVVHSWKDLPTAARPETFIAATLNRADVRDVLLIRKDRLNLKTSPWKILSSSPRRAHFLLECWSELKPASAPDLEFKSVRGNIPTRLSKLSQGEGDGLLVAKAALDRLCLAHEPEFFETQKLLRQILNEMQFMILPIAACPPAPAQGALAIEIRKDRQDLKNLLSLINHTETFEAVQWEREQLVHFGGGCHMKLGAYQKSMAPNIQLRIRKGEPLPNQKLDETLLVRKESLNKDDKVCFVSLETLDLFEVGPFEKPDLQSSKALYYSHPRTSNLRPPTGALLWTSGLATWKALAAQDVWINGSDESLGESRPFLGGLVPQESDLKWQKLSHSKAPQEKMELLPVYKLTPKNEISAKIQSDLKNGTHFFWKSYSLFEQALKLFPELKDRVHGSGPGSTRKSFEALKSQTLLEYQMFLDEQEMRMFYGAAHE